MALTKDQIIQKFLPQVLIKRRSTIVWGDIVSAVAGSSTIQKTAIVDSLKSKDYATTGRILSEILMASLVTEVTQDLTSKLADNRLTVDELSDLLA